MAIAPLLRTLTRIHRAEDRLRTTLRAHWVKGTGRSNQQLKDLTLLCAMARHAATYEAQLDAKVASSEAVVRARDLTITLLKAQIRGIRPELKDCIAGTGLPICVDHTTAEHTQEG